MKSNVDLTDNQDFRDRRGFLIRDITNRMIGIRFPWDEILKLSPYRGFEREELIVVGDKERRKNYRFESEADGSCQRCGRSLNDKPWSMETELCGACQDWLVMDTQDNMGIYKDVFLHGIYYKIT